MKKVIGQTVRDLKREVNKKVLKVPGIEQKVLDATSNEPWGPHGSLLADIAQATRNYHEYQMIMAVVWKRISDTGKNWRHVYKALTVLEYLVAHGSERVIDEIREHAYQISTLSDFQYIDSSGRDQGNNVRKKSQGLVVLVNDKEKIFEVRQKAAANRDKFRSSAASGMYRPGSYSSSGGYGDRYDYDRDEGRYGRDEEQNGYGREREYGYRDDDRGRYGDSYGRDRDRYGRDYEEHYGREGFRDDDYRGRSRSVDDYQYGSRSRSSDRDRAFDDDGQSSSRGSGARAEDQSQDGRRLERKFSEQNIGAPPSYEEAVSESRSPVYSERGEETAAVPAPRAASPPASNNPIQAPAALVGAASPTHQEVGASDEFDPRSPISAASPVAAASTAAPNASVSSTAIPNISPSPTATASGPSANSAEMDLLGSLSDSFSSNPLAIMPVLPATSEADAHANSGLAPAFSTTQTTQSFEDPFGDTPFKAIPSTATDPTQQQKAMAPFQATADHVENTQLPASKVDTNDNFGFGDSFSAITYPAPSISNVQPPSVNSQFLPQELSTPPLQETDILADILPPSVPSSAVYSEPAFSASTAQPAQPRSDMYGSFHPQAGSVSSVASNMGPQTPFGQTAQFSGGSYLPQGGSAPVNSYVSSLPQNPTGPQQVSSENLLPQQGSLNPVNTQIPQHMLPGTASHLNGGNFLPPSSPASVTSQISHHTTIGPGAQLNNGNFLAQPSSATSLALHPTGPSAQHNNDVLGNFFSQTGSNASVVSQPAVPSSSGPLATVPQSSRPKFEPKSTVWADTLSRGLVNLNISGPKINPLADIGVDFDAINRKEKRMEKQPAATPVTSTVTMGKAMGSGSGLGRTGASGLRPPPNPMIGSGMGMGMGVGMGVGMGMGMGMGMRGGPGVGMGMGGSYGNMNPPMGMAMGMNMGMNVGMGMNMGGAPMQPQTGTPGSIMPGGYNPMMGSGGYAPQQPYGGGYR